MSEKHELTGNVDWVLYKDWFEQDCVINFEPGTAKYGSLEISYAFD